MWLCLSYSVDIIMTCHRSLLWVNWKHKFWVKKKNILKSGLTLVVGSFWPRLNHFQPWDLWQFSPLYPPSANLLYTWNKWKKIHRLQIMINDRTVWGRGPGHQLKLKYQPFFDSISYHITFTNLVKTLSFANDFYL